MMLNNTTHCFDIAGLLNGRAGQKIAPAEDLKRG
jgi:hypothetical protein